MEPIMLNEYVSFEQLNEWIKTLHLNKEDARNKLETAINTGIRDGLIEVNQSYSRKENPDIDVVVKEKDIDDNHTIYQLKEDFSQTVDIIINFENIEVVAVLVKGRHPYFLALQQPEHAIIWESYWKGRL